MEREKEDGVDHAIVRGGGKPVRPRSRPSSKPTAPSSVAAMTRWSLPRRAGMPGRGCSRRTHRVPDGGTSVITVSVAVGVLAAVGVGLWAVTAAPATLQQPSLHGVEELESAGMSEDEDYTRWGLSCHKQVKTLTRNHFPRFFFAPTSPFLPQPLLAAGTAGDYTAYQPTMVELCAAHGARRFWPFLQLLRQRRGAGAKGSTKCDRRSDCRIMPRCCWR